MEATQKFDGMGIDLYAGKFSGSFDLETQDATDQAMDQEAYFVVRARVTGADMRTTRHGDLQRINIYAVADVVRIPTEVGFKLQTVRSAQLMLDDMSADLKDDLDDQPVA